jgi:hypothetical protein
MSMRRREHVQRVLSEIERLGGTISSVQTGPHIKVKWDYKGTTTLQVLANSPTDHRGLQNALAFVRRIVRNTRPQQH